MCRQVGRRGAAAGDSCERVFCVRSLADSKLHVLTVAGSARCFCCVRRGCMFRIGELGGGRGCVQVKTNDTTSLLAFHAEFGPALDMTRAATMTTQHAADDDENAPPLFTATTTSARQLLALLKCVGFDSKATLQISAEGIRVTVEDTRVMQGTSRPPSPPPR